MEKKNTNTDKKVSVIDLFLHGKIFESKTFMRNRKFILYLFALGLVYISLNFLYESAIITNRNNEKIIKNLKADYSSKNAKLLYRSKRGEIDQMLEKRGSQVRKPENPAKTIIIER